MVTMTKQILSPVQVLVNLAPYFAQYQGSDLTKEEVEEGRAIIDAALEKETTPNEIFSRLKGDLLDRLDMEEVGLDHKYDIVLNLAIEAKLNNMAHEVALNFKDGLKFPLNYPLYQYIPKLARIMHNAFIGLNLPPEATW